MYEDEPEPEPRTPFLHRARRGALLVGAAVAVGAAWATAYPYLATALLLLVTWLLRSASLAASATRDRRRLRGAKWYDPVIYLVGAPWHVVRVDPGDPVAGPVEPRPRGRGRPHLLRRRGRAGGDPVRVRAGVRGLAVGGARAGRGCARRWPAWSVHSAGLPPVSWLLALAIVLGVAAVLGYVALDSGVDWTPDDAAPCCVLLAALTRARISRSRSARIGGRATLDGMQHRVIIIS